MFWFMGLILPGSCYKHLRVRSEQLGKSVATMASVSQNQRATGYILEDHTGQRASCQKTSGGKPTGQRQRLSSEFRQSVVEVIAMIIAVEPAEVLDEVIEFLVHVSEQTEHAVKHIGLDEYGGAG